MEVKMKRLTSYFTSRGFSSEVDGNNNNKVPPSSLADTSSDGGEDGAKNLEEEEDTTTTATLKKKKRPLQNNEVETDSEDDSNFKKKKRRVDDNDDDPSANPDKSDNNEKADTVMTTTTTQDHPDAPIDNDDDDDEGESSTAASAAPNTTTTVSCPLHVLARAAVIPTPKDAPPTTAAVSSGGDDDDKVDVNEVKKIIFDIHQDESSSGSNVNKSTTDDRGVHTLIGESTELERGGGGSGDSANDENCPDNTTTTTTADNRGGDDVVDQTSQVETTAVISSQQQTPNEEEQLTTPRPTDDDTLSQKMEERKSSTTPVVLDHDTVETNQSSKPKPMETTTRNEDDATMDIDRTTERNHHHPTEQQTPQQHVEDSTNVDVIDAHIHPEVSVGGVAAAAESTSHCELPTTTSSNNNNNFESSSNTAKKKKSILLPPPSVSQLKMALFLEASRVHEGCKPERMFVNYWDAIENFIANHHPTSSPHHCGGGATTNTRSDPSFQLNATLELFLKTRKMKRLHNKLILALISDSVRDHVPVPAHHCSGDLIPREWRNNTRHYLLQDKKSDDDSVEVVDNYLGSSNSLLCNNWKSSFGNNAGVWSACGNSVTIAPRIIGRPHEYIAKKREEKEEVCNDEVIPSCRLPGALGIDLFVRKTTSDAGMTVSHDSMWLLIVAAREYASNIIGRAIDNDKDVTSGQTQRIPKSDYSSLSCEHLLVEKKGGGKKKDSKKKESAGKGENSKAASSTTERNNDSDKKRKVLTCADISQVLQEQLVAAPAWMKSMGRGMAHHQPDLEITNDIINASIQRGAIKRRRTTERKNSEAHVDVNAAPVAVIEGNLHDESALINEGLQGGVKEDSERKTEAAVGNGPSSKINNCECNSD